MAAPRAVGSVLAAIGNTPVVKLQQLVPANYADVYVKLEWFNPTGAYKDRMALAMIEEAEMRGDLKPGMTVVEYTGGSTGSSLAFVCACKGYRFHVVSSDAFSQEKLRTMQAFGAELEIVPSEGGQITPDLIPRMMARAAEIAAGENTYYTDQFNNHDSLRGYRGLGRELLEQLDQPIDVFCAAVGTAGLLMGVSAELKAANPATRIVALEPATAPFISTGRAGTHHVEGIGAGFWPPLLKQEAFDEVRAIDESQGRETARRLAREEGIFTGISSGLNVYAALQLARELGPGHTVVTVAVDTGLKYLAGDLYNV
ncbi:MAG: cysteine synthase family protein [Chloroflexota bacterium]